MGIKALVRSKNSWSLSSVLKASAILFDEDRQAAGSRTGRHVSMAVVETAPFALYKLALIRNRKKMGTAMEWVWKALLLRLLLGATGPW